MSSGKVRAARRADLAQVQADQRRRERRRNRLVLLLVAVVALALTIPAAILIAQEVGEEPAADDAPLEGLVEYEGLTANHVAADVAYNPIPPVGGDHDAIPQNCGFYAEAVRNENAVHSLEHGAVWVTFRPDLPVSQVDHLRELADVNPYLLASPYPDLSAPVVASAWGLQLRLDTAFDERLDIFLSRYLEGPQTPEPGAACAGGMN